MRTHSIQNKTISCFSFMLLVVFASFSCSALSSQSAERSAIPVIKINDDTRHSKDIVLGYTQKLNHLAESDGGVSLLLYKDSYVIVYYSAYMRRAGTYGMVLDESVMTQLWSLLTHEDTLSFNEDAVRRHIQALNRAKAEALVSLSRAGDNATTVIEIYPNRYQPVGFGNGQIDEMKQLSWHGLKWDAGEYPDVQEIQNLYQIYQMLHDILKHKNLERIE